MAVGREGTWGGRSEGARRLQSTEQCAFSAFPSAEKEHLCTFKVETQQTHLFSIFVPAHLKNLDWFIKGRGQGRTLGAKKTEIWRSEPPEGVGSGAEEISWEIRGSPGNPRKVDSSGNLTVVPVLDSFLKS